MAYSNDRTLKFNPSIERVVFERLPISVQVRASKLFMEELKRQHRDGPLLQSEISIVPDLMLDQMIYHMRGYLLKSTHSAQETISVRTPATWWDHLKHTVLLGQNRFLRYVVTHLEPPAYKYESKTVNTEMRVCPHNDHYFSQSDQHVQFLLWKDDQAQWNGNSNDR